MTGCVQSKHTDQLIRLLTCKTYNHRHMWDIIVGGWLMDNIAVVYKLNEKQKNVIRNRSIPYHLNAMMYYCLCQHVQMRKTQ